MLISKLGKYILDEIIKMYVYDLLKKNTERTVINDSFSS